MFGAYLGAVMAHFVIDAGLWRLRDPFPRAFLAERVPYLVPARAVIHPRAARLRSDHRHAPRGADCDTQNSLPSGSASVTQVYGPC